MTELEKASKETLQKALLEAAKLLIISNHGYLIEEYLDGQISELLTYRGKENE